MLEKILQKFQTNTNPTAETTAPVADFSAEENKDIADAVFEEEKKEEQQQTQEQKIDNANNYLTNYAPDENSFEERDVKAREINLYARLRNALKVAGNVMKGAVKSNKADNSAEQKEDVEKDSKKTESDNSKDKISSNGKEKSSSASTSSSSTGSKLANTISNIFARAKNFISSKISSTASISSNKEESKTSANRSTSLSNNQSSKNNKNNAKKIVTVVNIKSNIKNNLETVKKSLQDTQTSKSNVNFKAQNIDKIQSADYDLSATESVSVDESNIGSLESSKDALEVGIEGGNKMLQSVKNGSNSVIQDANENYLNSVEGFKDALNISDNPVITGIKSQISLIDKCISEQKTQLTEFDKQIYDVANQLKSQSDFMRNLSDVISNYSDGISDLEAILKGDIDDETASTIKANIAELNSARKQLLSEQRKAKEAKKDTEESLKLLNEQKAQTLNSIREFASTKNDTEIELQHLKDTVINNARLVMQKNLEILQGLKKGFEDKLNSEIADAKHKLANVNDDIDEFNNNLEEEGISKTVSDNELEDKTKACENDYNNTVQKSREYKAQSIQIADVAQIPSTNSSENAGSDEVFEYALSQDRASASKIDSVQSSAEFEQSNIANINKDILNNQKSIVYSQSRLAKIGIELQALAQQSADLEIQDISSLSNDELREYKNKKHDIEAKMVELLEEQEEIYSLQDESNSKINQDEYNKQRHEKGYNKEAQDFQETYYEVIEEMEYKQKLKKLKEDEAKG